MILYGGSLLWQIIIPLIVYDPLLSLEDLLKLLGDPFVVILIWLWIVLLVALVMVLLHLFGTILCLAMVFLPLHIHDFFESLNSRLWWLMSGFLPPLLGILICDVTLLSWKLLNGPLYLAIWPQSNCIPSLIPGCGRLTLLRISLSNL